MARYSATISLTAKPRLPTFRANTCVPVSKHPGLGRESDRRGTLTPPCYVVRMKNSDTKTTKTPRYACAVCGQVLKGEMAVEGDYWYFDGEDCADCGTGDVVPVGANRS